ncbi:hypothetical protein CFP65_2652 [Kitasatospora sp. MMS16-BH015]|uniref:RDD family protein n=1 Tax=Kitasatospora sp. MMS16-BH015 TaxID=2018025 RepID=UPI000CA20FC9|nr:RDD family protein [Kitasatospora sp. MMS16-BH015]AUG77474.1 hypothetical protein CFP65_2652 [Kitasatospora sp. MMS16-BH015]
MTERPVDGSTSTAAGPTPGYYPDPSVPGFVRYWGGTAWVPGTSRPAPAAGEELVPPSFVGRHAAAPPVAARYMPPPVVEPAAEAPVAGVPVAGVAGGTGAVVLPGQGTLGGAVFAPYSAPPLRAAADAAAGVDLPGPASAPDAVVRQAAAVGETGPVYFDQTSAGRSFTFRAAEAEPAVAETVQGEAPGAASGWQVDPRAQRGLLEESAEPRWVSWGAGAEAGGAASVVPGPRGGAVEANGGSAGPAGAGAGTAAVWGGGSFAPGAQGSGGAAAQGSGAAAGPADPLAAGAGAEAGAGSGGAVGVVASAGAVAPVGPAGSAAGAVGAVAAPMAVGGGAVAPVAPVVIAASVPPAAPVDGLGAVGVVAVPEPAAAAPQAVPVKRAVTSPSSAGAVVPAGAGAGVPRVAGMGRRVVARVVDGVVVAVVGVGAGVPLVASAVDHLQTKLDQAKAAADATGRQVQVWLVDPVVLGKTGVLLGVLLLVGVVYEVLPTARTGQTFGKRLVGVRVVRAGTAEPPALGRSVARWLVGQAGAVLVVGALWPFADSEQRRAWHDRAARTRVVRA